MTRLLFVDDHPLYRSGFELALARVMPELAVDLAASAGEALDHLARSDDVDLCLADLRLPDQDGLALLEIVGQSWPSVGRGLLCAEPTAVVARRAAGLGCIACLSKDRDMAGLAAALNTLFQGGAIFDGAVDDPYESLSEKRRAVLALAAAGKQNKEIAFALGITERTVKDHWAKIFARLEVANRAEAVSRAHRLGLI
jgi:DNA-binding NarL/FixJ family response regulator